MQKSMMTARTLWAALVGSTVMLLVVMFVVKPDNPGPPPTELLVPLMAVGVANAVVAVVLPMVQYRNIVKRKQFEAVPDAGSPQAQGYRMDVVIPLVFSNPQAVLTGMLPAYQTVLILGMALAESVALLGFIIGFLGLPKQAAIPFFVVCWILQATKFPTVRKIVGPVEKQHNARFPIE